MLKIEELFDVTISLLGAESETFIHRQEVPVEPYADADADEDGIAGAVLYAKGAARREIEARLRPGEAITRLERRCTVVTGG